MPTRSLSSERGWSRGVVAGTRLALSRPAAWAPALAGFLARGGLLLFIAPVVVLPTPTGLATAFGPDIISIAIATPNPGLVRLVAVGLVLAASWLLAASAIGGAADAVLIRWAAASLRGPTDPAGSVGPADGPGLAGIVWRVAVVRLVCHVPLLCAAAWAAARVVSAVYQQYISPGDLAVPLPVRVVQSVPDAIAALLATWLLGEVVGGLAARSLVLERSSLPRAIGAGLLTLVARPLTTLATLLVTAAVSVALIAPPIAVAAIAWSAVRLDLLANAQPTAIVAGALGFSAAWLAGMILAAIVTAWRSALWTALAIDRRPAAAPLTQASVAQTTPTGSA